VYPKSNHPIYIKVPIALMTAVSVHQNHPDSKKMRRDRDIREVTVWFSILLVFCFWIFVFHLLRCGASPHHSFLYIIFRYFF